MELRQVLIDITDIIKKLPKEDAEKVQMLLNASGSMYRQLVKFQKISSNQVRTNARECLSYVHRLAKRIGNKNDDYRTTKDKH